MTEFLSFWYQNCHKKSQLVYTWYFFQRAVSGLSNGWLVHSSLLYYTGIGYTLAHFTHQELVPHTHFCNVIFVFLKIDHDNGTNCKAHIVLLSHIELEATQEQCNDCSINHGHNKIDCSINCYCEFYFISICLLLAHTSLSFIEFQTKNISWTVIRNCLLHENTPCILLFSSILSQKYIDYRPFLSRKLQWMKIQNIYIISL